MRPSAGPMASSAVNSARRTPMRAASAPAPDIAADAELPGMFVAHNDEMALGAINALIEGFRAIGAVVVQIRHAHRADGSDAIELIRARGHRAG